MQLIRIIKGFHLEDLQIDCYDDGSGLLAAYREEKRYDLVLLDIRMNRMDGFTAIEAIRSIDQNAFVVFQTSLLGSAINRAFQTKADGYFSKPVKESDVEDALKKAYERQCRQQNRCVVVQVSKEMRPLEMDEILYIEMASYRSVRYMLAGDRTCTVNDSMKATLDKLSKAGDFIAISRQTIVNALHVSGFDSDNKCLIVTDSVTDADMSVQVTLRNWERIKTDCFARMRKIMEQQQKALKQADRGI